MDKLLTFLRIKKEFDFVVPMPVETYIGKLEALNKPPGFWRPALRVQTSTAEPGQLYQLKMVRPTFRQMDVVLEARIEQVDEQTAQIAGMARIKSIDLFAYFAVMAFLGFLLLLAVGSLLLPLLIFGAFYLFHVWYAQTKLNNFIDTIQETVNSSNQ